MDEPMNYQQALESGYERFYFRPQSEAEFIVDVLNRNDLEDWRYDNGIKNGQFLPIPTPEELLSEVEVEVSELFTFHSDCVDAVELPEYKFTKGDRVRVRKVSK